MITKTVFFTGHRKINNQHNNGLYSNDSNDVWSKVHFHLVSMLQTLHRLYGTTRYISGGAIGFDQVAAHAVIRCIEEHGMPFELVIARPFPSQASRWPDSVKDMYDDILSKATTVVDVSSDPYSPAKMQIRNEWMVNNADYGIACWTGVGGGTKNCIDYSSSSGKPVLITAPDTLEMWWMTNLEGTNG